MSGGGARVGLLPQLLTLARQDSLRALWSRRAIPVYLLAAMPLSVLALRAVFRPWANEGGTGAPVSMIGLGVHLFMLRFVVFFGCATIFINLVRGEMLDRTLHYRLVLPMRREAVFAGKYLGGLAAALSVFLPLALGCYFLLHLPHGFDAMSSHFFSGQGPRELLGYTTAILLATTAYGAFFFTIGLFSRSPLVPVGLFLAWEAATPFLPPILKAMTVWYHLMSFNPVPLENGVLAVMADPTPTWLATVGLVGGSALLLSAAAWRSRTLEINYTLD